MGNISPTQKKIVCILFLTSQVIVCFNANFICLEIKFLGQNVSN